MLSPARVYFLTALLVRLGSPLSPPPLPPHAHRRQTIPRKRDIDMDIPRVSRTRRVLTHRQDVIRKSFRTLFLRSFEEVFYFLICLS